MSRVRPYLKKPDEDWHLLKAELAAQKFFLMARNGPSVFSVKDETGEVFKTTLGNPHACSCAQGRASCIHILFCVLKVLRVPEQHPLAFQHCFTDSDLDAVLKGDLGTDRQKPKTRPFLRSKKTAAANASDEAALAAEASHVTRQTLGDQEYCAVCQDEMTIDQPLTWCRKGCGNNLHAKCMQTYSQYRISNKKDVECPLCRTEWLLEFLKEDLKLRLNPLNVCARVYCHSCTFSVKSEFYRCIECSQPNQYRQRDKKKGDTGANSVELVDRSMLCLDDAFASMKPMDFCMNCLSSVPVEHVKHHFISSNTSYMTINEVVWNVVKNPKAPRNRILDSEFILSLQNREFSDADYFLLQTLDNDLPPLAEHLASSLPIQSLQDINSFECWCAPSNPGDKDLRELPCSHSAHYACVVASISDALSNGIILSDLECKHRECAFKMFPGLGRQKRKRVKKISADTPEPVQAQSWGQAQATISSSTLRGQTSMALGIGISGKSILQNLPPPTTQSSSSFADHSIHRRDVADNHSRFASNVSNLNVSSLHISNSHPSQLGDGSLPKQISGRMNQRNYRAKLGTLSRPLSMNGTPSQLPEIVSTNIRSQSADMDASLRFQFEAKRPDVQIQGSLVVKTHHSKFRLRSLPKLPASVNLDHSELFVGKGPGI